MRKLVCGAAIAAGLLALAGCDKPAPDQPVANDNAAVPETNVVEATNAATPAATTHAVTSNASEAVAREAPRPPDEQTQDDADATGMTSRVNRDQPPANGTAP